MTTVAAEKKFERTVVKDARSVCQQLNKLDTEIFQTRAKLGRLHRKHLRLLEEIQDSIGRMTFEEKQENPWAHFWKEVTPNTSYHNNLTFREERPTDNA